MKKRTVIVMITLLIVNMIWGNIIYAKAPLFNGDQYIARLVKITNLKKENDNIYFNNAHNKQDNATYIVTKDTYVDTDADYLLGLESITNDLYAHIWYYTDAKNNKELLKIEIMSKAPQMISHADETYGNDPNYQSMLVKVKIVEKDISKGMVSFTNLNHPEDKTVYVVDENTEFDTKSNLRIDTLADNMDANIWFPIDSTGTVKVSEILIPQSVATVVYSDIPSSSKYYDAALRLSSLNIMQGYSDNTFGLEKNITRAEMAKIMVRALGLNDESTFTESVLFTDVEPSHWAYNYIKAANDLGLINGNGDGTFFPDDNVTYEQAIKMVVSALGYKPMAEMQGDYPTGYLNVAKKIKITDEVSVHVGQPIARGNVALMINKALDVPLMEQTGFGSDITYQIQDGTAGTDLKTLMTEKFSGNTSD